MKWKGEITKCYFIFFTKLCLSILTIPWRLIFPGLVKRKTLVLDLDETLIHSHHDGVLRQTVKPGTPPDFILKVTIDRHPVRFFVHKRPHVDFFLEIVSHFHSKSDQSLEISIWITDTWNLNTFEFWTFVSNFWMTLLFQAMITLQEMSDFNILYG